MKKTILLIIAIVLCNFGFSQVSAYKITKTTTYQFNDDDGWYVVDSTYPKQMYMFIEGKKIKVTDAKKSNYFCYGEVETSRYKNHTTYSWKSVDEETRDCTVMIKSYNNSDGEVYNVYTLAILYEKQKWLIEYDY